MAIYKSSFNRALKPSILNTYVIEIVFCILISIFLFIFSFKKELIVRDVKLNFITVSQPIFSLMAVPFEILNNSFIFFEKLILTFNENKVLREQNNEYKELIKKIKFFELENYRLQNLLDINYEEYAEKVIARILIDPYSRPNSGFYIDIGKNEGIKYNDIVFNEYGLLGRIEEVGKSSSKVMTILNQNSVIPVISGTTKKSFFVQGNISNLKIKHLEDLSSLEDSEEVFTTEAAGYFKQGIRVGSVAKLSEKTIILPDAKKSDSIYVSVLVFDFKNLTNW